MNVTVGPEAGSPFRLDGRVALVTGAGSADGIGQAIARVYAAAGAASSAARTTHVVRPRTIEVARMRSVFFMV